MTLDNFPFGDVIKEWSDMNEVNMKWMSRILTYLMLILDDHGTSFSHFVIYTILVACMVSSCLQRCEDF